MLKGRVEDGVGAVDGVDVAGDGVVDDDDGCPGPLLDPAFAEAAANAALTDCAEALAWAATIEGIKPITPGPRGSGGSGSPRNSGAR